MKKNKGFTLIELLIVVAIIGIIAAIAIPNLLDAIERSRQKRSTAEIKSMAGALQSFSTDYGGYPNDNWNGAIDPTNGTGLASAALTDASGSHAFLPDYIQAFPVGDGWKTPYQYQASAPIANATSNPQLGDTVSNHFVVGSFGSDVAASVGGGVDAASCSDFPTMAAAWCVTPPIQASNPNMNGNTELHCYATDIIWGDSSFLQAPEGKQRNC
ncbi:MAG: prepilin-type N-terminal cleavage/methylation domain-containing protein [Acidobacteria bacterium]|nr:prepilin-type N-terminal cleavage/methylation domain-containing protein [Acidobacteriota bacterium]